MFEVLKQKYNINDEFRRISNLFKKKIFSYYKGSGIYRYKVENNLEEITRDIFPYWKCRRPYVNYQDMRNALEIDVMVEHYKSISQDNILIALEYYINILTLFKNVDTSKYLSFGFTSDYNILNENIDTLLDYIHYQKHYIPNEQKVILIPKDPAAMAVAEQSSEDTSLAILMYNHASLKGNLEGKKDILRRIAQEYEPLLDKKVNGFSDYFDKANNMLNNLHIRHNNEKGKYKKELVITLNNEELEKWYDELYQLLLFCVLIIDNIERKKEIEEFLKILNKKD